ncbi:putative structure-specific endonuclease subunit SLX4 [Podospora fimiseda]|uniref:Structure-specific endonuclease subunit SLX4 n=1 Tax=Podospora fimiseda TaxID=252190 RepID=A0AAN7GUM6_9PEZI|nr:putative structure-specific endonuclease subunit SLX4 [Podospora fimiseda]
MFSSSPAAMGRDDSPLVISSSPEFPSLCDLVPKRQKQSPLRSGSNAAPIPAEAPRAFTSAAQKEEEEDRIGRDDPIDDANAPVTIELSPDPAPRTKSSRSRAKKAQESRPRKEACQVPTRNLEDSLPDALDDAPPLATSEDAAAPKKRGRKPADPATAQTTLPKGKVTKPGAKVQATRKKRSETVSRHFAKKGSESKDTSKPATKHVDDEPIGLEPAMKRRLDWTPIKNSTTVAVISDSSMLQDTSALTDSPAWSAGSPKQDIFKKLHDTFGRKSDDDSANTSGGSDVLGKRKHIQMFVTSAPPPVPSEPAPQPLEKSPPKKAPKKKPRTITELATAAYRPEELIPKNQGSLLGFVAVVNDKGEETQLAEGSKTKAPKKSTKATTSKKKAEPQKQILLSPASALRQVSRQDFVFGTSSQLAKEDDPDLLRALHEAMKVSNQADSDPFASSSPIRSEFVVRRKTESQLWAAGARDEDGELLSLEVLDLTGSSPITQDLGLSQKFLASSPPLPSQSCAPSPKQSAAEADDLDDEVPNLLGLTDSPPLANPATSFLSAQRAIAASPRPAENHLSEWDDYMPPSNQEHHELLMSQAKPPPPIPKPQPPPRPRYELYTDAQLTRDVAKYGFKPVKKRTAMIALVDQCWASRNQPGLSTQLAMSTSTKVHVASKSTATGSPRGRPRKNSLEAAWGSQGPDPLTTDYNSLKIPELKKLLQERGLKVSGNKPDLLARLQEHDKGQEPPAPTKSPRSRSRKDGAKSPVKSPKKAKSPSPKRATSPWRASTPRRRNSLIEIQDSDMDLDSDLESRISSPASRSSSRGSRCKFRSRSPMDLSMTENEEADISLIADPTTQQISLFGFITKAVTSAPPAKDPSDPSWYEKMLMYDPIIIEDLTEWLNSGELGRVGFDDGEVDVGDVKKWCESKSVCCLWKVTNNKRERKRF